MLSIKAALATSTVSTIAWTAQHSCNVASVLDPENNLDIVALHHTCLPWIQHQLDIVKDTWSQHKLWSCGSRSPLELWIMSFLAGTQGESAAQSGFSLLAPHRTQEAIHTMGLDPDFLVILADSRSRNCNPSAR